MNEFKGRVTLLVALAQKIDETTERIDRRTEENAQKLTGIDDLKVNAERIANAIERSSTRMFVLSIIGLLLLSGLSYMLITAVFNSTFRARSGDYTVEMGK